MSRHLGLGLGVIVVAIAQTTSFAVAQLVPPKLTMQALTVPNDRLPEGCSLKVIEPARREVIATSGLRQTWRSIPPTPSMQPAGVIANPWTGTDRRTLADLRQRIDGYGALRFPDAPPLTRREASELQLKFADGVEEGYAATYAQAGREDLGVWAVRLAAAPATHVGPLSDRRGNPPPAVINIGFIRALVLGSTGGCSSAIQAHLKSLGR